MQAWMCFGISDDHPVSSFMDQLIINAQHKNMLVIDSMREIFKSHPQIWNNESYRKSAICILTRMGTNDLLYEAPVTNMSWSLCSAMTVVVLEHYNGTSDIDLVMSSPIVRTKWRALNPFVSSCRRDALKFYRKINV